MKRYGIYITLLAQKHAKDTEVAMQNHLALHYRFYSSLYNAIDFFSLNCEEIEFSTKPA